MIDTPSLANITNFIIPLAGANIPTANPLHTTTTCKLNPYQHKGQLLDTNFKLGYYFRNRLNRKHKLREYAVYLEACLVWFTCRYEVLFVNCSYPG